MQNVFVKKLFIDILIFWYQRIKKWYTCMYIYMYVYIHVCIYICMYIYICMCIYIYIHIYIYIYTHIYIYVYIYSCKYNYIHKYIFVKFWLAVGNMILILKYNITKIPFTSDKNIFSTGTGNCKNIWKILCMFPIFTYVVGLDHL